MEKDPKEVSILGYMKGGMHGKGARKHPKGANEIGACHDPSGLIISV